MTPLGILARRKFEQKWVLIVFVFQNKYLERKILFRSRKKCSLLIYVKIKLYDTSKVRLRWDFKWTWLLFGIKLLLADDGDTFSSCISKELSIESRCTSRKNTFLSGWLTKWHEVGDESTSSICLRQKPLE